MKSTSVVLLLPTMFSLQPTMFLLVLKMVLVTIILSHMLYLSIPSCINNNCVWKDAAPVENLTVQLKGLGEVQGMVDPTFPNVRQFLGYVSSDFRFRSRSNDSLPYALPPVGHLRWKRPLPMNASWHPRVRSAHRFSAVCPQHEFYPRQSEDCLYLNVYTPRRTLSLHLPLLPVLVYLYGGGYFLGSGSEHKLYDGSFLVQRRHADGVVVVTLNYRLGVLGFMQTESEETNFGLYDQQMALLWVHQHIRSFGGDPDRVTLWGQSAGAYSVAIHLTSPSPPLFQRAILQSPPLGLRSRSREEAWRLSVRFMQEFGCADTDCMRRVDAGRLVQTQLAYLTEGIKVGIRPGEALGYALTWFPVVDNELIHHSSLVDAWHRVQVPVLMGSHVDEAFLIPWALDRLSIVKMLVPSLSRVLETLSRFRKRSYPALMFYLFGKHARQVLDVYPASDPDAFWHLVSDFIFFCPTRRVLLGTPTGSLWQGYTMNLRADYLSDLGGVCAYNRSCHASELPYVFHSGYTLITMTPEEHRLSLAMMDEWFGFASGAPSAMGWTNGSVLKIKNQVDEWAVTNAFGRERLCALWVSCKKRNKEV